MRELRLPWRLRLASGLGCLAALAAAYGATGSAELQVVVLLAFLLFVLPELTLRFGVRDHVREVCRERAVPSRVTVVALLFALPWGALVLVAVPDLGFGPWFWFWVFLWPWTELVLLAVERQLARRGAATWPAAKAARPLRDAAVAGACTVPLCFAIFLLQDDGAAEAALAAAGCGAIVFASSAFSMRREGA